MELAFIIKQFDFFASEGVKNVKIADELFVLNPNHFLRICELIIERGYKFNIWAYSRVDTCKPKYLDTLKKAGVNWLGLGIENPDNENRRIIHKEGFKEVSVLEQISTMLINVGVTISLVPFDDMRTMRNTLDFALENPTEMANFIVQWHIQVALYTYKLEALVSSYQKNTLDIVNIPMRH